MSYPALLPKNANIFCADALSRLVRSGFANIADDRSGDAEIVCTDALMSAFAMFSLTSPSLLAFDKQRTEGNVGTVYGMEHVPCDTHLRERLDPVSPESLRPSFKSGKASNRLADGLKIAQHSILDEG